MNGIELVREEVHAQDRYKINLESAKSPSECNSEPDTSEGGEAKCPLFLSYFNHIEITPSLILLLEKSQNV